MADLEQHVQYSGGYTARHPTIRALWAAVRSLSPAHPRAFLTCVSGCSRPPLLGFRHLVPAFCVHRSGVAASEAPDESADLERLPTAATCMNLLKLPPYSDAGVLLQKLTFAITSESGFDLS